MTSDPRDEQRPDAPEPEPSRTGDGDDAGYWERQAREQAGQQGSQQPGGQQPAQPQYGQPQYGQPQYGQPQYGQPQYGQQGYGQQGYAQYPSYPSAPGYPASGQVAAPNHPKATTCLVLGIVALAGGFTCGLPILLAPVAWVMGQRTVREIDASGGRWGGRGQAQTGFVLGVVGTVLLVLFLLLIAFVVVLGVTGNLEDDGGSTTSTTTTAAIAAADVAPLR